MANHKTTALQTPGIVAYWRMREATGAVLDGDADADPILDPQDDYDLTPGAGAQEPQRVATLVPADPTDYAYRYTAGDLAAEYSSLPGDYHEGQHPDPGMFDDDSSWSIEFMFQRHTTINHHPIVQVGDNTLGQNRVAIYCLRSGTLACQSGLASTSSVGLEPLNDMAIHHIVITYEKIPILGIPTRVVEMWVDGVSFPVSVQQTVTTFAGSKIYVGTILGMFGGDHTVDELKFYRKKLTPAEIAALWGSLPSPGNQAPITPAESSLTQEVASPVVRPIGVGALVYPGEVLALRVTSSEPDGDTWRAEFEVRPAGTAFTGVPTHYGPPGGVYGTDATKTTLVDADDFSDQSVHWRVRCVDSLANASPWVAFGYNPSGNGTTDGTTAAPDFISIVPEVPLGGDSPLPSVGPVSGRCIVASGDAEPVFVDDELQGTDYGIINQADTDDDDGESSGSARCDVIDIAKTIRKWDWIQIWGSFAGLEGPLFFGRINDLNRGMARAEDGGVVSLTCVGNTAEILKLDVTTPHFHPGYLGFLNWHSGGWTRSEMIEDLCRIYGVANGRRVIESTWRIVQQKPYVQVPLGDVMAEIGIPEFAKFKFGPDGRFRFWVVRPDSLPTVVIREGETLFGLPRISEEHEKVANQILVVGASVDPVNVVKPAGVVGRFSKQIDPGQVFSNQAIEIDRTLNDALLTHSTTITQPTGYAIANMTGQKNIQNPTWAGGPPTSYYLDIPKPSNREIALPYADDVTVNYFEIFYQSNQPAGFSLYAEMVSGPDQLLFSKNPAKDSVLDRNTIITVSPNDGVKRFRLDFNFATGGQISWGYNIDYRQVPEVGKTVTVTKDAAAIAAVTDTQQTTTQYIVDINETTPPLQTFQSDTVEVAIEVTGRAIATASFPLNYFTARDQTSIDEFSEQALELRAASINTIGEAAIIAAALLAACKDLVETFEVVMFGNPWVRSGTILDVETTSPNAQLYFGASRRLYCVGCSHSLSLPAGDQPQYLTTVRAIPIDRAVLSIVRNFGLNPVKQRAAAQAEFLAGYILARITEVVDPGDFVPGEVDPQRYGCAILSAGTDPANPGNPYVVREVQNNANEQFAVNDTVLLVYEGAHHQFPQITGRSPNILVDGVPMLLEITNATVGSPTTVTTKTPHGLFTGNQVAIYQSNSSPLLDGTHIVTVTSPTTFTIPVAVAVSGTYGIVVLQ